MKGRHIINICIILLFFGMINAPLHGQYDEKAILLNKAQRAEGNRATAEANRIYREILSKYPGEMTAVERLVRNLLMETKTDDAQAVLDQHGKALPYEKTAELSILIQVRRGESRTAMTTAREALRRNPGNMMLYNTLARAFESVGQWEQAIDIYLAAREVSRDTSLNAFFMAVAYDQNQQYDKAVEEYFKHLARDKNYNYAIFNQLKRIMEQNPATISDIEKNGALYEFPEAKETVAKCLILAEQIDKALLIFEQLPPAKLYEYANQQLATGKWDTAEKAFRKFLTLHTETFQAAEARVALAQIHIARKELGLARPLLELVYNDQTLADRRYLYRTRAHQTARELLAHLALMQGDSADTVIGYLEDAKKFTYNINESNELTFRVAFYMMMLERTAEAETQLSSVLRDAERGSETETSGMYYTFMLYTLSGDAKADTLLNEMVIRRPESDWINDAMELNFALQELKPEHKPAFLSAFRSWKLLKTSDAVDAMQRLFTESANETILLLAADWALEASDIDHARRLFSHGWQDPLNLDYATLQLAVIESDKTARQQLVTTFLTEHPGSVFSPAFRNLLTRRMMP